MKRSLFPAVLIGALVAASAAAARPGDPDPSFSDDGVAVLALSTRLDSAAAVAVQADGKIVLVGAALSDTTETDLVVTRLDLDGSLDETFASAGTFRLDLAGPLQGDDVAIDSEGRIIAGGRLTNAGTTEGVVVRLLPTGAADATFDADGVVRVSAWPIDPLGPWRVAVRPNDRVVFTGPSVPSQIVVGQLATDGSPDASFGTAGYTTYGLGGVGAVRPGDVFVDRAGRPTVLADTASGGSRLARFTADGLAADPLFDVDATTVGFPDVTGAALLELRDGLGLITTTADGSAWGITALDADGGFRGFVPLVPFPDDRVGRVNGAALQPDGRIVVVAYTLPAAGGLDPYVARFSLGRRGWGPDRSFGADGITVPPVPGDTGGLNGIAIAPDGSVVAAGSGFYPTTRTDTVVVRLAGQTTRCDGKLVTVDLRLRGQPTAGDDVILGTRRADAIRAGRGNDTVCGGRGPDFINGGQGTDTCIGGRGRDRVRLCE